MIKNTVNLLIMAVVSVWLSTSGEVHALQKPAEFSGDLVITTPDSTIKAKIYVKDPSIHRVEMSKEAGGMIFIRPPKARGSIWMLDPVKKQYRILSWPQVHKDPVQAWTDIQYDMGGGPRAEEVINGYQCTVFHFKYKDQDKIALKMWFAEDLQYTIKREADAKIAIEKDADPVTIKGIFEVVNIKTQTLDDILFKVPPDYVKVK